MIKTLITKSALATQEFAQNLAKNFINGGIIALTGDLGAGKTTFVQGFAKGLGIKDKIISPTFVLIKEHHFPNSEQIFYHLDLYRLEEPIDISAIGLKDSFKNPQNIILIEWAEKLGDKLPIKTLKINIEKIDGESRKITIT